MRFKVGDLVKCNPSEFTSGSNFSTKLNETLTDVIEPYKYFTKDLFINEIAEVIEHIDSHYNVLWWPRLNLYNFLSDICLQPANATTTEKV